MKGKIVKIEDNQYWVEIPGHAPFQLEPSDVPLVDAVLGESEFEIVEHDKISGVVKYAKLKTNNITRLEVVNHAKNTMKIGRVMTLYKEMGDFSQIELSYQDNGRTLKIFLD